MIVRIVLTGPECTGKTTLARLLAAELGAPWVPEAARRYATERAHAGHPLTAADVEHIARRQMASEDEATRVMGAAVTAPDVADAAIAVAQPLVLDTDLISTVAYARHYYGSSGAWLDSEARARLGSLYLLCAPDIPWTADGVRDRPHGREQMFAHFERVLDEFGAHTRIVRGLGAARLAAAVTEVAAHPWPGGARLSHRRRAEAGVKVVQR